MPDWIKMPVAQWNPDFCTDDTTPSEARRIAELEEECATLAAGQCIVDDGLLGDEYGHAYCRLKRELSVAREEIQKARAEARRIAELEEELSAENRIRLSCEQHIIGLEKELAAALEEIQKARADALENAAQLAYELSEDPIVSAAIRALKERKNG